MFDRIPFDPQNIAFSRDRLDALENRDVKPMPIWLGCGLVVLGIVFVVLVCWSLRLFGLTTDF